MLDRIFATIGILGVVAFMGIVAVFVMEPDLWIVSILVISISILFIWRDLKGDKTPVEPADRGDSEN